MATYRLPRPMRSIRRPTEAIDPFTPKFFGTTQIGQFTVDSYPALGGVLMIAAGTLGPVLLAYELWRRRRAAST